MGSTPSCDGANRILILKTTIPTKENPQRSRWLWAAIVVGLLVILFLALLPPPSATGITTATPRTEQSERRAPDRGRAPAAMRRSASTSITTEDAERVVAKKLSRFARSRREFAYALARRHGVAVSDEVEAFFSAVESGNWAEIESTFQRINGGDSSATGYASSRPAGIERIWPAIIDAYGVAEQVHEWSAKELLEYGNAVLGALRPGMVYVGGTDSGRWIPELLNDTSDGERHIIITQNGLADLTYLDYLQLQYDHRFNTLTADDSQKAFSDYVADATRRLQHDRQFPDEPMQVRPGEEIHSDADGRVRVSGPVAVMSINERLLQSLMAKNEDAPFALQESSPLQGTYAEAVPLGPLMELGAADSASTFTADRAEETVNYWRDISDRLQSRADEKPSEAALKSYAHDAAAAANLMVAHGYTAEAEKAYRLAANLWPGNPESVGGLADLLRRDGRVAEARKLLEDFARANPDQRKDLEMVSEVWRRTSWDNSRKP